jgi:hypothetical protein
MGKGKSKPADGEVAQTPANGKQRPVREFRMGRVRVSVWLNQTDQGARMSASPSRSYKDQQGSWQSTQSFGPADLPLLAEVTLQAWRWMHSEEAYRLLDGGQPEGAGDTHQVEDGVRF